MSARGVLRVIEGERLGFWCPGCMCMHMLTSDWAFDGNYEHPTFAPSVLVTCGHYVTNWKPGDSCWCTFNAAHPERRASFVCSRCHSFVRAGYIQFLMDCTHALRGQTIALTAMQ